MHLLLEKENQKDLKLCPHLKHFKFLFIQLLRCYRSSPKETDRRVITGDPMASRPMLRGAALHFVRAVDVFEEAQLTLLCFYTGNSFFDARW